MTYASEVAADSPVAWWKLNETSGTSAADSGSGTAANGTYTGGFTLGLPGIDDGDAGASAAVKLDGINGYITVGALPAKLQFPVNQGNSTSDFSVEAWCAFDGRNTNPGASLVCEAYAGDGTVRYMLGFGDSNAPLWGWHNTSWRIVTSPTALTDSSWHHLVGTYDGTANQLELWVDKVSVGTLTPGGTQPTGSETLYIGRRWDNSGAVYFNGYIDEVAMYSTKLSSTRIAAHYDAKAYPSFADVITTSVWTEVAASTDTVGIRVTGIWAEAAIDEFWHGFGTPEYGSAEYEEDLNPAHYLGDAQPFVVPARAAVPGVSVIGPVAKTLSVVAAVAATPAVVVAASGSTNVSLATVTVSAAMPTATKAAGAAKTLTVVTGVTAVPGVTVSITVSASVSLSTVGATAAAAVVITTSGTVNVPLVVVATTATAPTATKSAYGNLTLTTAAATTAFPVLTAPSFAPDNLSGLKVWLKADAITGKNDGDAISQWDDSSGGSRHFTQATGVNQPLYKTNQQNGKPSVRFDGSNDYLSGGDLSANWSSAATIFIAYKNDQTGNSYDLFSTGAVDQWFLYDNGLAYMGLFRTARINVFPPEGMPSYGPRQMCVVSSSSRYDYYADGHKTGAGTTSYSAGTRTDLGAAVGGRAMKGDVYEVVIYDSALSDTDRGKVEAYLAGKWGIDRSATSGTPTGVAGCRLWLRADAITGLSDADPVEVWKDESGYAHDFDMRRTTSVRPLYKTNLYNSKPGVRFDGSNDTLRYPNMGAMDFPSAATLFVVFKPNSDTDYSMFSNTATNDHWQWTDGNSYLGTFRSPRIDGYPTSGNFGTTNTLMLGTIKSSSSTYVAYKNGTSAGAQSASYPSSWSDLWQIGNGISAFNGDVMEVIAYDTALGDTDRGTIESYLNTKYSIW